MTDLRPRIDARALGTVILLTVLTTLGIAATPVSAQECTPYLVDQIGNGGYQDTSAFIAGTADNCAGDGGPDLEQVCQELFEYSCADYVAELLQLCEDGSTSCLLDPCGDGTLDCIKVCEDGTTDCLLKVCEDGTTDCLIGILCGETPPLNCALGLVCPNQPVVTCVGNYGGVIVELLCGEQSAQDCVSGLGDPCGDGTTDCLNQCDEPIQDCILGDVDPCGDGTLSCLLATPPPCPPQESIRPNSANASCCIYALGFQVACASAFSAHYIVNCDGSSYNPCNFTCEPNPGNPLGCTPGAGCFHDDQTPPPPNSVCIDNSQGFLGWSETSGGLVSGMGDIANGAQNFEAGDDPVGAYVGDHYGWHTRGVTVSHTVTAETAVGLPISGTTGKVGAQDRYTP